MDALYAVPMRDSENYGVRINVARAALNEALKELWRECLQHLNFRLPLLILDEAHHLSRTQRLGLPLCFKARRRSRTRAPLVANSTASLSGCCS